MITKLADKWRDYRCGYTDKELTEYGKARVGVFDELANQLTAALPVWTRITDDEDTWPEMPNARFFMLAGKEHDDKRVWQVITDAIYDGYNEYDGATHWRPLCDIDYPPEEN